MVDNQLPLACACAGMHERSWGVHLGSLQYRFCNHVRDNTHIGVHASVGTTPCRQPHVKVKWIARLWDFMSTPPFHFTHA